MKKLIALVLISLSFSAFAQHGYRGHHNHNHYRGGHAPGWGWVAPALIGGAIVYGVTRPVQAETVIVQPQPVYVPQESCTPWKEIQTPDGRIYRERTCTQ